MANTIKRAWFIDKANKLAIIEKSSFAITKDGYTSNWKSISEIKDLRLYTISRDADLSTGAMDATWNQIPEQWHEVIVYKAIATGYKDPRHLDIQVAQYFDQEYSLGVAQARKESRNSYQSTGTIKQQDF